MRKIVVNVNGRITFLLKLEDDDDEIDDIMVSEIAETYYSENDGWEDKWPINIVFTEGENSNTFNGEMEAEPVFYASETKTD